MASKWKKRLKKVGKAAAIGAALYAGAKGLKGRGKKVFPETENINIGVGGPQIEDAPFIKRKPKEWHKVILISFLDSLLIHFAR